jgi:hypothetical protein
MFCHGDMAILFFFIQTVIKSLTDPCFLLFLDIALQKLGTNAVMRMQKVNQTRELNRKFKSGGAYMKEVG